MPRQCTFLGRPVPRFGARRLTLLLVFVSIFALFLIGTLTVDIPSSPSLAAIERKMPVPHMPQFGDSVSNSVLNPFRQQAHPPPRQKNDEYNGSSWWADWKWLSVPFSSSVTLDEDRALLPHLANRQPIYCYYDATVQKTTEEKDAESDLLLIWRRAWWARGFKPVILSAAEAMNNPLYMVLQGSEADPALKRDMMRWLAWESMGGGLLSQHIVFPMGVEYSLLPHLRRGEFPHLTRWDSLEDGLFSGGKDDIHDAIRSVLDSTKLKTAKTFLEAVPDDKFVVDEKPAVIAYYTADVIKKKYPKILDKDNKSFMRDLNGLVNAHLQSSWQNSFPRGIDVLKPLPDHTTAVVENAIALAKSLVACPKSPMPGSCPPNIPNCGPCGASTPLAVRTPKSYVNDTTIFSIGIVPHPWTLTVLDNQKETFNTTWIRTDAPRDPYLYKLMQDLLGSGVSSSRRVLKYKEIVVGDTTSAHSLWLTAERPFPTDLEWYFGFEIPKEIMDDGKSLSPVPAERDPNKPKNKPKGRDRANGPVASKEQVAEERVLLERAKKIVALSKSTTDTKLRGSLEAWSMADTEAWKFTRAFQARRALERSEWEKEEAKYNSGSGSEAGRSSWNRWQDRKEDSG